MDEENVSIPAKKSQIAEPITVSPVHLFGLLTENVAKSPSKKLPCDVKVSEKEHLCRQTAGSLAGIDELAMLRRQVE
jgi:hypothetical protein